MMPSLAALAGAIAGGVSFVADLVAATIGIATIIAFFRYRKRLSAAIRLMRMNHLTDRRNEIRETLLLISEAVIEKGRSSKVRALFGRLNGQLLPLCVLLPELADLQKQAHEIAHENGKLNEAVKQQLVHQVEAQFESCRLKALGDAAGDG